MTKQLTLTQENLEALLAWLDPDRDQAGKKYEHIRRTLIKIFTWNGCLHADDGADETINRVIRKVPELRETYSGDPAVYFYGVAKNVVREFRRRETSRHVPWSDKTAKEIQESLIAEDTETDDANLKYECLQECLQTLTPDNRRLILQYYQQDKQEKIDSRRVMAERTGIDIGNLRVRIHRIRTSLHKCIDICLKRKD